MRAEQGFAMLWAMFLVILVGALGAVVLERDLTARRDEAVDRAKLEAFQAAEGGIARARHELRRVPNWPGGRLQIAGRDVQVEVSPAPEDGWLVIAQTEPGPCRLEALLHRRDGGLPALVSWRQVR